MDRVRFTRLEIDTAFAAHHLDNVGHLSPTDRRITVFRLLRAWCASRHLARVTATRAANTNGVRA
jgi:hypothetical protein